MKSKFIFITFIGASLFLNCREKEKTDNLVQEYYGNGQLEKSFTKKGTLIIDTLKIFWPSGKLKEITVYDTNGIANGIHELYDVSGKKILSTIYTNGVPIGYNFDFYPGGNLKGKGFHLDSLQVGNTYHYDERGNVDTFLFFDFKSKILIEKQYSNDSLLRQRYTSYFIDTILTSSDKNFIRIGVILARPPHESNNLFFYKIGDNGKIYDSIPYKSINEFDSIAIKLDYNLTMIKMKCIRYDSSNQQTTLEDGAIKIK